MIDNVEIQAKLLFSLKLNILEGIRGISFAKTLKGKKIKLSEKYGSFSLG